MNHDGGPARHHPATVIATWPKGGFAENLAIDSSGAIFVSLHIDRAIVRIDPVTHVVSPFATFDRPVTGLAFLADGTLMASGGSPGQPPGVVWRISPAGEVQLVAEIEDGGFLNGITPFTGGLLVADSLDATIFRVQGGGAVSKWLVDPLLAPLVGDRSPGANGIKLFGDAVTISVTGPDRLVRAPIIAGAAGQLTVIAETLRADDFAFDTSGALYIATHPAHSLVRLGPDGGRSTLAEAEHGLTGSTAVAFGRTERDRHSVYVTTTGGTWTVPDHRLEKAKLVRVDVGVPGHPLLGA